MKQFDRTIRYSLIQSFYWMAFAAVMSFSGVYLLGCGFTNSLIGLIVAFCGLISAFGQTAIAGYIDRTGGSKLKPTLFLLLGILLALSVISLLLTANAPFIAGIFFSVEVALLQIVLPLVNSLAVGLEPAEGATNFGVARGLGSLAYAAAAALLGSWAAIWGVKSIPAALIVIYGLLLVSVFIFQYHSAANKNSTKNETLNNTSQNKTAPSASGSFLGRYPRFALLLAGAMCVYISHSLINSYAIQIMNTKGWDSVVMGNAAAIAAVSELPLMFCFAFLTKKKPVSFWLRISGIAFFLKTFFTLLSGSIAMFYGIQVIQMFGWAIISVASVAYVDKLLPAEDAVKGQSYFTMSYTAATVIAGLMGSAMIDRFGMNPVLVIGSVLAGIGAVIMFIFVENVE